MHDNRTYVNRLLFSVVSLVTFASCASEYKIEGSSSVSRLDGKMLFVKVPTGKGMTNLDSAEVVHGMFRMEGVADSAIIASLYMDDESIMPFVVEKGRISIDIGSARMLAGGTPLNDRLYGFVGKKISLDDRAYELERLESRLIMDGKTEEEIHLELDTERQKLADEMNALAKNFIQENYDNVLGPGVFIMMCNAFPYPVLTPLVEEILDAAPDSFRDHPMIKEYVDAARTNMERLKHASR